MVNAAGLALIKRFEGCVLHVYLDPVKIPTVGVGHVVRPKDNLKLGQRITQAQADRFLQEDLKDAEADVDRLVKVPLNPNQRAALVSFVFNLGGTNFAKSTLLRKLNAGDFEGAANEFGKWVNAGGERLPGLVRRREAEKKLFLTTKPDFVTDGCCGYVPASSCPNHRSGSRSTLRRGDTGTSVLDLQRALGFVNSALDGNFGKDTEHAIREFQAHHGLVVDGVAGPRTNEVLFGGK